MRFAASLIVLLALTGCDTGSREVDDAEAQYRLVDQSKLSTNAEKCRAASRVRDAWLKRKNRQEYESWQLIAASVCGLDD